MKSRGNDKNKKKKNKKNLEGAEEVFIEEQGEEENEVEDDEEEEDEVYKFNNLINDSDEKFNDLEVDDTPEEEAIIDDNQIDDNQIDNNSNGDQYEVGQDDMIFLNTMSNVLENEYREPNIALQEISNDVRRIVKKAQSTFNKEHFQTAESVLMVKWSERNKPWVFCDEGIDDLLLKKEIESANKFVRLVPEERMKKYDLVNRLILFIQRIKSQYKQIDETTRQLTINHELKGKFKILEDWTSADSNFCTYLIYNHVFQRKMILKCARDGQYRDLTKYQILLSLWKRISDHPNVPTIHYIELINDTPCLSLEYTTVVTLDILVENGGLLRSGNHMMNLSVLLKIMGTLMEVLEYAHSNSVLHLNLFPNKIQWTVQDYIENSVYQIANPLNRNGILLSEFGNLLIIDMEYQQYDKPYAKRDLEYIKAFWPPLMKERMMWLINNRGNKDHNRVKGEFLEMMSTRVDLFSFGAVLLFIINNGQTWKSGEELLSNPVSVLMDRTKDYFDKKVYDRLEGLLIMFFLASHNDRGKDGFLSFYDAQVSFMQEFGYLISKINLLHSQFHRSDKLPVKDQPVSIFKSYLSSFYNEYYFGNYKAAVEIFNQAKSISTLLGKENEELMDSFTFNDMMLKWIKGKVSVSNILNNTQKYLNIQLVSHLYDDINLHETIKLLPTIVDSRYVAYFDKLFKRLAERYIYQDHNKIYTMISSNDRSNVSNIYTSSVNNLMIVSTYTSGITIYGMDRMPKSNHPMKGVTSCSSSRDCLNIIFGTNVGVVCHLKINKDVGRIEDKSLNQLYKHDGYVKLVEISYSGNIGMSFAIGDMKLIVYDLDLLTAISEIVVDSILSSYSFDGKAARSVMSYENSCVIYFTDNLAPSHRRMSELVGHNNYVNIVRLSYDSCVGLSCDLSNKIIYWNLQGENRKKIREIDIINVGYIFDLRCTPFSRFFVVKTSNKVILYEPKINIIWYEYECDSYNSSISIDVSNPIIELLIDNRIELYETIVDYKSGKPLIDRDNIIKKCNRQGMQTIKNSTVNIMISDEYNDTYRRMKMIIDLMDVRMNSSKEFYEKFDIMNPYKIYISYGLYNESQQIIIREIPMEISVDYYIDLYSNNQRSFLFSSSLRKPFNIPISNNRLNNYQQYLAYMLNRDDYKMLHKKQQYHNLLIKEPQYFFTLRTLIIKSGRYSIQQEIKQTKKIYNNMQDKILDDNIEVSYVSSNNTYLLICTVDSAYCYKMPSYDHRYTIDIRLNNQQIGRIMKAFNDKGVEFDIESSVNTFDRNCISCCATSSSADILVVGYIDGYMHVINTYTKDILHIVQAHVDMITCVHFTKNDILLTGGIDSNIKVWGGYREDNIGAEYTFLKHTDSIAYIRSYTVNNQESILSSDIDGIVYYWNIGTYKADKHLMIDEKSVIDGNDTLIYGLSIESSCIYLKKYSFSKRSMVNKCIVRHFSDMDDMSIRSMLGYNDSEVFNSKIRSYIRVARSVVVVWIYTNTIYMYNVDKLTLVYNIQLSSIPNTIRCLSSLNDMILMYNDNIHVLRMIDTHTDINKTHNMYDIRTLNIT